jgi:nitrite reductase/ring-hydroxylating ferredoxin subunit/DMSO/TMAO reductase YedYZ heme-binding membrane subunit
MSVEYKAIGWNPQKKTYDGMIAALSIGYLAVFVGFGVWMHPTITIETLLIRGLGTLALFMLHVILAIGPLCRLDTRFLPLLYNRRHLGVAMFIDALVHGSFSLIQFHALGDTNPLVSVLVSNQRFASIADFPFELFGLAALLILFLMAATSHDFWLHNLTPTIWKRLHMSVYAAYVLVFAHVCLGALQSETSPILAGMVALGAAILCFLHIKASARETAADREVLLREPDGFSRVCSFESIPESRAKVVTLGGERVAVFKHHGKVSALSNVCRHQNGPLGEGRIIDGCVTCPWHGYQYDPETGVSPPPFDDRVATFPVKVIGGDVWVQACPK